MSGTDDIIRRTCEEIASGQLAPAQGGAVIRRLFDGYRDGFRDAAQPAPASTTGGQQAASTDAMRALVARLLDEFAGNIGEIRVYAQEAGIDLDAEFASELAELGIADDEDGAQ